MTECLKDLEVLTVCTIKSKMIQYVLSGQGTDMRNVPVKERIVVFRYKFIPEDVYCNVCDALGEFLSQFFPDEGFCAEKINTTNVTVPAVTYGNTNPDLSKIKITINSSSRFWNVSRTMCVQFFRDYITFNLLSTDSGKSWNHNDLFDFVQIVLPFMKSNADAFQSVVCSIDYLNEFNMEMLRPYITNEEHTLQIGRILRGQIMGQQIDGATFGLPFIHKVSYLLDVEREDSSSLPTALNVHIEVPKPRENGHGWCVQILLSASANCSYIGQFEIEPLRFYLNQMHDAVYKGFKTTFTDEIVKSVEACQ